MLTYIDPHVEYLMKETIQTLKTDIGNLSAPEETRDLWNMVDSALTEVIPETLRSLIVRRFEALPDEERLVLEAASAIGIDFAGAAVAGRARPALERVGRFRDIRARSPFRLKLPERGARGNRAAWIRSRSSGAIAFPARCGSAARRTPRFPS